MTDQFPQYSDYLPRGSSQYQPKAPQPVHPSLGMHITSEQRDRGERFLAEAYADGRLNEFEFDARMDQVLAARTRQDLNQAFYGLVDVPRTSQALGLHPAYHPTLVSQSAQSRTGRASAAVAHFSPFFTGIFGPLFIYLIGTRGSYARREAARAFNFQFISMIGFVAGGMITAITDGGTGFLLGLYAIAWFVLTILGGVKAAAGEDWKNPVRKVVKWEILSEK